MRLDHPIFNEPLDAGVTLVSHEWEKDFDDSGVWVVQTGEPGKEVDYGVVSDGHGFEDSPGCERITGGVNSKGPYAVAIGREANMLQWGFYAAPDRMTESAKRAFLNAIIYMKQFDGHRPVIAKAARGRGWVEQKIQMIPKVETYGDSYADHLKKAFPKKIIAENGLDMEVLGRWHAENVEYLYSAAGGPHIVDEDLAKLGVSNRRPEFLEMLRTRLEADPQDLVALRLAERYLDTQYSGAENVLEWIDAHGEHAFFSDVGGYKWFANAAAERAAAAPTATDPARR